MREPRARRPQLGELHCRRVRGSSRSAKLRTPGFVNTWVLIQFGHNDQPGKPGRSTDLATEFPANLRRYVKEARAAGAKPVLITPLTRRMFKNGELRGDLGPWADAAARVAAELDVPLVDLPRAEPCRHPGHGAGRRQRDGPAATVACRSPPRATSRGRASRRSTGVTATEVNDPPPWPAWRSPKLSFDYTHLGGHGADYFATMVTAALALAVPDLRPLLIP